MKTIVTILSLLVIGLMFAPVCGAATMNWSMPAEGGRVDGFNVYIRSLDTPAATVGPDVFEYPLDGLFTDGETATVGVSAFNAAGESPKRAVTFTYDPDMFLSPPGRPPGFQIEWIREEAP